MLPQLYHAHHIRHMEDIPFWLGIARQFGDPLLELGCGTGRVLAELSKTGIRVFGMDIDIPMLQFCKSNLHLQEKPYPQVFACDFRVFNLAAKFPLIILPCNTFSTLDFPARAACLGCVRRHLTQGGTFTVSLPNPLLLKDLPSHGESEPEDEFIHPLTGNPVQVSSAWDRTQAEFTVTWSYDHLSPDGSVEHLQIQTIHRLTFLENYRQEFKSAGLSITEIYGDYDRSAYSPEAPFLIILASPLVY